LPSKVTKSGLFSPETNGLTTPADMILLTVVLPKFATNRLPLASNARPSGRLSPPPLAKVETTPAGVILLTLLPLKLTVYRLPLASNAKASGPANPPPEANGVTTPAGVTLLIVLPLVLET